MIFLSRNEKNVVNILILSKSEARQKLIVTVDLKDMSVKGILDTGYDKCDVCKDDNGMFFFLLLFVVYENMTLQYISFSLIFASIPIFK